MNFCRWLYLLIQKSNLVENENWPVMILAIMKKWTTWRHM